MDINFFSNLRVCTPHNLPHRFYQITQKKHTHTIKTSPTVYLCVCICYKSKIINRSCIILTLFFILYTVIQQQKKSSKHNYRCHLIRIENVLQEHPNSVQIKSQTIISTTKKSSKRHLLTHFLLPHNKNDLESIDRQCNFEI